MSTRFWLVRHGPTHATGAVGWTDIDADLSDVRQVEALASALPVDGVTVSSDLRRAIDTADAICPGSRLAHDSGLREIHFGAWEGRDFTDIERAEPDLARSYWERPGDVAPPGGESWNGLRTRVASSLARLATDHAGRDVICVAHLGVILAALAHARDIPAAAVMGFQIDPLSLTRIEYLPGAAAWRVLSVNQVF